MARMTYDDRHSEAFARARHVDHDGLADWRAAVARHLRPRPGLTVLDVGAGTGTWARAFTDWYAVDVVAVEPSETMRTRSVFPGVRPGHAADVGLDDASVDAAWLSTVIHHVPDLPAAARELRRVVRPGGPVLIRSVFAGRPQGMSLFHYFPEAVGVLDTYPSVDEVRDAFAGAGFGSATLERVAQVTAPSLAVAAAALRREAHTLLELLDDEAYAAGLARLRAAVDTAAGTEPLVDTLDLLVLR